MLWISWKQLEKFVRTVVSPLVMSEAIIWPENVNFSWVLLWNQAYVIKTIYIKMYSLLYLSLHFRYPWFAIVLQMKQNLKIQDYALWTLCTCILRFEDVLKTRQVSCCDIYRHGTEEHAMAYNAMIYVFFLWYKWKCMLRALLDLLIFPHWLQVCETPSRWVSMWGPISTFFFVVFPHTVHFHLNSPSWILWARESIFVLRSSVFESINTFP